MRTAGRILLPLSCAVAAGSLLASSPDGEVEFAPVIDQDVVDFIEANCADCHNDFQSEGDRSFDAFLMDPQNREYSHLVVEMLDEINRGTMPKKRDGVAMPTDEERRATVALMTSYLTALAELEVPEETPLRRLSNAEYRNTMRDLLGLNADFSTEVGEFAADANVEGLTNLARAQNLSQRQLQSYVVAGKQYLDAAFARMHAEPLEPQRLTIPIRSMMKDGRLVEVSRQTLKIAAKDWSYLDLTTGRVGPNRPVYPLPMIDTGGVENTGIYVIRVTAEALQRDHGYDQDVMRYDATKEPLKIAIGVAPSADKTSVVYEPERRVLEVYDVPDEKPTTFEVKTLLRKGEIPFYYWPNSGTSGTSFATRVIINYYPELIHLVNEPHQKTGGAFNFKATRNLSPELMDFLYNKLRTPRLRIHSMELLGPFPYEKPHAVTSSDLRRYLQTPNSKLGSAFVDFASKAFRRPVAENEIAAYLRLTQSRLDQGASKEEALKLGFAAVLASPRFLYLDEGNADQARSLDNYQIASRLSYFLWSSMPDETLLKLAESGEIQKPEVVREQVRRMLRDERANAFVSGFTNAWLRLDKLGSMPPDAKVRGYYFQDRLEDAMRKETELVFSEILFANRPTKLFLNSDFTYVNGGLARLYKIPGIESESFQRVPLGPDQPRRGLIGHASILTASANGIDTSPVLRGVWVQENLFGTPPPPPPPDVPAIEPDQRGATTVRQLLEKHRSVQACADCHANIDPYGVPLEVFGPVGEFRRNYDGVVEGRLRPNRGLPVETDTVLPNGQKIDTLKQFTSHLLDREDDFQKHLVEKLMTYGSGRETSFGDRAEIQQIVDELEANEGGFEDMIVKVASSHHFLTR